MPTKRFSVFLICSLTYLFSYHALAADKHWFPTGNQNWNLASHWSPTGVPDIDDDVFIGSPATSNPIVGTAEAKSITMTSNRGIEVNDGGELVVAYHMTMEGIFDPNLLLTTPNLLLEGPGSEVTIGLGLTAGTKAGQYASVYQQNGTLTTNGFTLGNSESGAYGHYTIEAGTFNTSTIIVGRSATGIVDQSGGTVTATGWIAIGTHTGGNGEINLSGGLMSTDTMWLRYDALFDQSNIDMRSDTKWLWHTDNILTISSYEDQHTLYGQFGVIGQQSSFHHRAIAQIVLPANKSATIEGKIALNDGTIIHIEPTTIGVTE